MKIWVLFSTYNDYDQPPTLFAWWQNKPTLEMVAKVLGHPFPCEKDEHTLEIVNIWKGDEVRVGEND